MEDAKQCDRCGNDFQMGRFGYNFPFRKGYLVICHICHYGLIMGMRADFKNWVARTEVKV